MATTTLSFLGITMDGNYLLTFLGIIIWPLVVFIALLSFRKILVYLFFSLEEFNLFGLMGKLENPQKMIQRKAKELIEKEKRDKEIEKLQKDSERLEKLPEKILESPAIKSLIKDYKKLANDYILISKNNGEKTNEIAVLRKQISALLAQISKLQSMIVIQQKIEE